MLAVLVRLVEKHPESFIEQQPCWQTQQPLEEKKGLEERKERMNKISIERKIMRREMEERQRTRKIRMNG